MKNLVRVKLTTVSKTKEQLGKKDGHPENNSSKTTSDI